MTREEAILESARQDMRDHLRDFCKHGPAYLEEYIAALVTDATATWRAKARFHPKLAEFLRELALDAAVMERRSPSPPSGRFAKRDNDRPLTRRDKYVAGQSISRGERKTRGAVTPNLSSPDGTGVVVSRQPSRDPLAAA